MPADLRALLGRCEAPLLLDVRPTARFRQSDRLLWGAQHCAPEDLQRFIEANPPRDVIAYCVHGHGVSQQAAQDLREAGWAARYLLGGIEGGEPGVDAPDDVVGWRAEPLPIICKRPDLGVTGEQPSRWITRDRPKIDRVACPWLIRRFIDRRAEFFYVPVATLADQARQLGAVPYDVPAAPISHQWERCSFDSLLDAFGLDEPALHRLARIVRGADTSRLEIAKEAAGLLAISLGLSRMHAQDDRAMLEAAMPIYDALFEWCRSTHAEPHGWRSHEIDAAVAPPRPA